MSGSGLPGRSPLRPDHQRIVDAICVELHREVPDGTLVRGYAEQAVRDLLHSISLASLPEMAIRLTLVRLDGARVGS